MFLQGVSTRKIGKFSHALWGKQFSAATVSAFNTQLKEEFLLRQLLQRGLDPKELGVVVTDGSSGLKKALALMLPGVAVQRCIVHKLWNVTGHTQWSLRGVVPQELKRIFYARTSVQRVSTTGKDYGNVSY
jgi:transposase-like protein